MWVESSSLQNFPHILPSFFLPFDTFNQVFWLHCRISFLPLEKEEETCSKQICRKRYVRYKNRRRRRRHTANRSAGGDMSGTQIYRRRRRRHTANRSAGRDMSGKQLYMKRRRRRRTQTANRSAGGDMSGKQKYWEKGEETYSKQICRKRYVRYTNI